MIDRTLRIRVVREWTVGDDTYAPGTHATVATMLRVGIFDSAILAALADGTLEVMPPARQAVRR